MKTDVISVYSDLRGRDEAMRAAEKFAAYHEITGKDAMHLRLLTEETISMAHGIFDDFMGKFWLESQKTKKGLICRICLSADRLVNKEQEAQILSVSTSGRNERAKGVMGKIREIFRHGLQSSSTMDEQYLQNINDAWLSGGASTADSNFWSLQLYRQNLSDPQDSQAEEWDELEKSIIARLADEVKVWLDAAATTVIIEKQFDL